MAYLRKLGTMRPSRIHMEPTRKQSSVIPLKKHFFLHKFYCTQIRLEWIIEQIITVRLAWRSTRKIPWENFSVQGPSFHRKDKIKVFCTDLVISYSGTWIIYEWIQIFGSAISIFEYLSYIALPWLVLYSFWIHIKFTRTIMLINNQTGHRPSERNHPRKTIIMI